MLKKKGFPPEPLLSNVKRTINSLENNKVILGMGEVQSGKTLFLTVLIAWLFKRNMFDLVLFFTDKTNIIKQQTFRRIKNYFKDWDINAYVINKVGGPNISLTSNNMNKKVFILIKQNDVYNELHRVKEKYKNLNILVINDEGDDTNTGDTYSKHIKNVSIISDSIKLLYLTATPFKNLFKKDIDEFIYIQHSNTYIGIDSNLWDYNYEFLEKKEIKKSDIKELNNKFSICFRYYYYEWLKHIEKKFSRKINISNQYWYSKKSTWTCEGNSFRHIWSWDICICIN